MTIGTQDLETIRKEVASVQEFYTARMDKEIPPLKEELERVASRLERIQEKWRDSEKQAILARYDGQG